MSLAGLLALTFAGLPGPLPHPDGAPPTAPFLPAVPGAENPMGPPDGLRPSSIGSSLARPAVQPSPDHTDLALLIGEPGRGPQFELGALGGGRSDAPGLVHVGVRFGF